ncbi:uncharacterized protein gprin3a [Silurus meridionalis]|uniref:uncharacterized protein gprin3a n=1 Tax=Silurus meridionalis TaxID=175797 RepID=UPI001EEAAA29|nr:uncharacterized protein gprin3a [Silurus meridionalis]
MFQKNKDEDEDEKKNIARNKDGILKDIQVERNLKGSDVTLQVASKGPFFSRDRLQLSPGATTTSASQVKETRGKTDENTMDQERMCARDKRKKLTDGMEGREALVEIGGEYKWNIQEKKTEEEMEKEKKVQDRNTEAKEKERKERQTLNQIFKCFKDAATMTEENPVPVQTLDAVLQTELLYEDAGVQAVVEVSNKYTTMSPNITHPFWSQIDHRAILSNREKVSVTANMSFQNRLSQDVVLNSVLSSTPHKSSISPKPARHHVCQIQIELCSQSTVCESLALPGRKDPQASSSIPGLEKEPKQVDRDVDQAEAGQLPEVAWDEQGMTWEIYGAAVDMESLGFAIQNHLQHKIQEHEQRIRHLRKSISLSEHSNGEGKRGQKTKKKRKVFQSLFQRPTCCLKAECEA